jgi:hypothetical protein
MMALAPCHDAILNHSIHQLRPALHRGCCCNGAQPGMLAVQQRHMRSCTRLTHRSRLTPFSLVRLQDDREKDPAFVSDAYAECYPAFHDFGTTVVDSDEEDMSHMDKKMVRVYCVIGCSDASEACAVTQLLRHCML